MAWRGAHIVPRKGDTLPPPDEKMRHGEVEYVGPAEGGVLGGDAGTREGVGEHEGGKKEKKDRLGGLFYRKEKEHYGEEGSVVG